MEFDPHDEGDFKALERLRVTMGLETTVPETIYIFANIRLQRYQSELEQCRKALELAKGVLGEACIDVFAATDQRRRDAQAAIDTALKVKSIEDLIANNPK